MSEKKMMHSLKPHCSRASRTCSKMATPTKRGKEESPRSSVSHKCSSLCSGKASTTEEQTDDESAMTSAT